MIRVMDIVEVYLLPKMIARLAVKRYPSWTRAASSSAGSVFIPGVLGI